TKAIGAPGRSVNRIFGAQPFGRRFEQGTLRSRVPSGLRGAFEEAYVAASPQLASSPVHRGHRAAIPRRDTPILQAAINHPPLLHEHLEELAPAQFRPADTPKPTNAP